MTLEKLPKPVYDYIAGGANSEWCIGNNLDSIKKYQIVPRMLQNVKDVDTNLDILGIKTDAPIIVGPSAFHKLVNEQGEKATAKACERSNTIMTLSTMSSCTIEEIRDASSFPKWFQLYCFRNRKLTEQLVRRAELADFKALVITVDVPAMGLRLRDIRNHFSLPPDIDAANLRDVGIASFSTDSDKAGSTVKNLTDKEFDPSVTWETIDWIQSITKLPVLLKGILHPDDALEALKHNVKGIIVSNHGGRQLDHVISTTDALANISPVIKNQIPLFVDGGIRSGEDVFKMLALGATAVLIARPVLWSLAVSGEDGVCDLLNKLKEELTLTMRLTGCPTLQVIHDRNLSMLTAPYYQQFPDSFSSNNNNQLTTNKDISNTRHFLFSQSNI